MKRLIIMALAFVVFSAGSAFSADMDMMMSVLKEAKKGVGDILASADKDLSAAAKKLSGLDLKSEEARNVMRELSKGKDYTIETVIVDPSGKMISIEPEAYRNYEGSDISDQAHIKAVLTNKKPVFSNVFLSVEGDKSMALCYPVFSEKGELKGIIILLARHSELIDEGIAPLVKGIGCKGWVMQKDGLLVYDEDPDQIGRNIFRDSMFYSFDDLKSFARSVAAAPSGFGTYDFYAKGFEDKTVVKKYAVWDTVAKNGAEWRVIIIEAEPAAVPAPSAEAAKNTVK